MKFTREQAMQMAMGAGLPLQFIDSLSEQNAERITRLCTLAADAALEAAAVAFEQHNRENRQWVNGSLWGNLTTEGCARIRAMKEHQ
jgi:hypothetical protein